MFITNSFFVYLTAMQCLYSKVLLRLETMISFVNYLETDITCGQETPVIRLENPKETMFQSVSTSSFNHNPNTIEDLVATAG